LFFSTGTYVHPDLAYSIAQWLNPRYHIAIIRTIRKLQKQRDLAEKESLRAAFNAEREELWDRCASLEQQVEDSEFDKLMEKRRGDLLDQTVKDVQEMVAQAKQDKIAAEQAKIAAEQDKIAAAQKYEQDKIAAEQAKIAAAQKYEQDKIAAEQRHNELIDRLEARFSESSAQLNRVQNSLDEMKTAMVDIKTDVKTLVADRGGHRRTPKRDPQFALFYVHNLEYPFRYVCGWKYRVDRILREMSDNHPSVVTVIRTDVHDQFAFRRDFYRMIRDENGYRREARPNSNWFRVAVNFDRLRQRVLTIESAKEVVNERRYSK
jgi:hypothetical protein